MLKSKHCRGIALLALMAGISIFPATAQETLTIEEPVSTESSAVTSAGIEEVNQAIEAMTVELMISLSPTGTYAITSADESTNGVPIDFLAQTTTSLQSSLMKASDYQIKLIDQTKLSDAWSNAVEFNGADFEALVANAGFDAMIVLQTRATKQGIDISLQVIGTSESNSGQVLASTKTTSVPLNWAQVSGIDVDSFDAKIAELDNKIEGAVQTKVDAPILADVTYSRYVGSKECTNPTDPCEERYTPEDRIVAIIDGKKLIADRGIEGSKVLEDSGWDTLNYYLDEIVWQGDFDNDGYNDVVLRSDCGGSGCPPIYRIVLYRGNEKFSTLHLRPLNYPDIEFIEEGFHFVLKLVGRENFQESASRISVVELEFRVENGELVERNNGGLSTAFSLKEFSVAEAVENYNETSCEIGMEQACVTWEYDLTGDNIPEVLSCGYWSRWQALVDCELKNTTTSEVYRLDIASDTGSELCKTIAVLEETKNGMNQLSCDFWEINIIKIKNEESRYFYDQGPGENTSSGIQNSSASVDYDRALQEAIYSLDSFSHMLNMQDKIFVQELLNQKGLYTGSIDGDWGLDTQNALRDVFASLQNMQINYSVASIEDFVSTIVAIRDFQGEFLLPSNAFTSSINQQSSKTESGVAPSFDCNLATTDDEFTICSDADLAKRDVQLAVTYQTLKDAIGSEKARDYAISRLKERRKCKNDTECIRNNQIGTIDFFNKLISPSENSNVNGIVIGSSALTVTGHYFRVIGVASNDVLNIREEPSSESRLIGSIPHDDDFVEVIEENVDGGWLRVNIDEGTGWVSERYLAPIQIEVFEGTSIPVGLRCFATEPYTTISFNLKTVLIETLGVEDRVYAYSSLESGTANWSPSPVLIAELQEGPTFEITEQIEGDEADRAFPYSMRSNPPSTLHSFYSCSMG